MLVYSDSPCRKSILDCSSSSHDKLTLGAIKRQALIGPVDSEFPAELVIRSKY